MKQVCHLLIALAGGITLLSALGVNAEDTGLGGNPYAVVAVRNIFGLNPPAPVNATPMDDTPPPKITPNGIMSIFGQLQVLFKVTPVGKAPKPGGDDSYILSEGQRQDDIEVVKINEKAGIVTFNNHGTVQELPLVAANATSTPAPAGGAAAPGMTFRPATGAPTLPGNYNGNRALNGGVGGRFGGSQANNTGAPNNDNAGGFVNTPARTASYNAASQIPPGVTPEVQTIMIEANREAALQNGDAEAASILPITELTPQPNGSQ
jgi:hypothetical protein